MKPPHTETYSKDYFVMEKQTNDFLCDYDVKVIEPTVSAPFASSDDAGSPAMPSSASSKRRYRRSTSDVPKNEDCCAFSASASGKTTSLAPDVNCNDFLSETGSFEVADEVALT